MTKAHGRNPEQDEHQDCAWGIEYGVGGWRAKAATWMRTRSLATTESAAVQRRIAGYITIIKVYHGQSSVMNRRLLCAGPFDTDDRLNQEASETQVRGWGATYVPTRPRGEHRRRRFWENREGLDHEGGLGQNHTRPTRTHPMPALELTTGTHPMTPTMGPLHHPRHMRHHPAHGRHARTAMVGSRLQGPQPHEREPSRQQHPGRTTGRSEHGHLWVLGTGNHPRRAMGWPSRQGGPVVTANLFSSHDRGTGIGGQPQIIQDRA